MKLNVLKYFASFLVFLFFVSQKNIFGSNSKHEIDSSLVELATMANDTAKVNYLLRITENYIKNDIKLARRFAHQALLISKKIEYENGMAAALHNLGRVYLNSDLDIAMDYVLKSLKIKEAGNDSIKIADSYNLLGNIKIQMKDYNGALEYYQKALRIYTNFKFDKYLAGIYNNIGSSYSGLKNDSLTIFYIKKALEINIEQKQYLWQSINYANLGMYIANGGDTVLAMTYFQRSLELADSINYKTGVADMYNIFSEFYCYKKQFDLALDYVQKAYNLAVEMDNLPQEKAALHNKRKIYYAMGNFVEAYNYLLKETEIDDTLYKLDKVKKMEEMELKFAFENEQKIIQLQHNYEKMRLRAIIGSLGCIILLISILLYIAKSKAKQNRLRSEKLEIEKQHLNDKLETKNRELASNIIHLVSKNELIQKLIYKLGSSELRFKKENQLIINGIINELRMNLNKDVWKSFETGFEQVHPDFYSKLNKDFPELTQKDKRLCAFLRLNMTSKEIAEITHQSVTSTEMARIRLRKKLNISSKDVKLTSFMSNI